MNRYEALFFHFTNCIIKVGKCWNIFLTTAAYPVGTMEFY